MNKRKEEIDKISKKLNNTPRKVLGFKTPKELLLKDFLGGVALDPRIHPCNIALLLSNH